MVGDLFSVFVLTRTISENSVCKVPGQRPFSAFVLTRTISEGPLSPGGSLQRTRLVPPKILVPRYWYQDLGTKILVPRSWYQDLWGNQSGTLERPPPGERGPSEIVLVRTNAENRSPTIHSGPPRTLSQRMSSWGQTLREPPQGGRRLQRIKAYKKAEG